MWFVVAKKELIDNLRDRRTWMTALIMGPLLGPLLFVLLFNLAIKEQVDVLTETQLIGVIGADNAPNLIAFLEQNGIEIAARPDAGMADTLIRERELNLVLKIPDEFADDFRQGRPAAVEIIFDGARRRTSVDIARIEAVLNGYSTKIGRLRLMARGISPGVTDPVTIVKNDLSTSAQRGAFLLSMMSYLLFFSMLMGGFYLAIDTTAGERERRSLESLLTLPVSRATLLTGKLAATCAFMLLALAVAVTVFVIALGRLELEEIGMTAQFGLKEGLLAFAILAPFALPGGALMTLVASFTRSFKEAQTYLSVVNVIPIIPLVIAALYQLAPDLKLMLAPGLAQHLLLTELMQGESLQPGFVLVSAVATTLAGLLLGWLAYRAYRREAIIG